jgi:hypothetical protein
VPLLGHTEIVQHRAEREEIRVDVPIALLRLERAEGRGSHALAEQEFG